MNWFGEQIQSRTKKDRENVSDALLQVADSIDGKNRFHAKITSTEIIKAEVGRICHYFELEIPEETPSGDNINELIDYLVRPDGILRRRVILEDNWWANGDGPLLAVMKDTDEMRALIPRKFSGYRYYDRGSGSWIKITKSNKDMFEANAVCFYRPLPPEPMSGKSLIAFLMRNTAFHDVVLIIVSILLITLLGIVTPLVTQIVFARIIPAKKYILVISTAMLLVSVAVGSYLLTTVRTAVLSRIVNRMDTLLQNAVIGRMLNLPVKFFSDKSSGGLSQSIGFLTLLPNILTEVFFSVGITAAMSAMYVIQIAVMAPALSVPALITFILEIVLVAACMKQKSRLIMEQLEADMSTNGLVFSLFSGIQKIKLSGSENRAFIKWASLYRKKVQASYRFPFPAFMQNEMVVVIQMTGLALAYWSAAYANVSVAQFAAFSSAFGMVMAALLQLSASSELVAFLNPVLKKGEIILKAVPETSADKKLVKKLNGSIELNNVSFCYEKDGPKIVDGMNLKIAPGEYVAIVGKSGCGKSTLMRLMLGFEYPDEGAIYYSGIDLNTLDMASFRRNVGTVLQSGKLFAGDIFSNITISAPWLKMDDAWDAARMAGMAEDIENMPMGMHTVISEGSGGISGGQRQRLMIARAIAPKPSILMFDEATSALDNITQKIVSDSLNNLKCTRIVIAHRLSTIKECNRIIVLDAGKIIEDGTYEELIAKNGFFADLVSRQQIDYQHR